MPDLQTILALAGSLKMAGEMTKAMVDIRDGAKLQAKIIELQGVILGAQGHALSAQSDLLTLVETVRSLEKQLAEVVAWEQEKDRYQLTDYGEGTFAYQLKADKLNGEPPHRICAKCFQEGHKSILQYEGTFTGRARHHCPRCNAHVNLGAHRQEPLPTSYRKGSWMT